MVIFALLRVALAHAHALPSVAASLSPRSLDPLTVVQAKMSLRPPPRWVMCRGRCLRLTTPMLLFFCADCCIRTVLLDLAVAHNHLYSTW